MVYKIVIVYLYNKTIENMKTESKILVGGQALRNIGSDRHTDDIDYLINDVPSKEAFITSRDVDYLNANGNRFFEEVWEQEKGNDQATPQALFDLKAYSFVQHCQNFNFQKADAAEYDMKFLVRNFDCRPVLVKKYISSGEFSEIMKIVRSVKI